MAEVDNSMPHKQTEHDEKVEHHKIPRPPPPAPPRPPAVRNRGRPLCAAITVILILAGIAVLTVWLLYHPSDPKFRLVTATVYQLNTSSPPFISTNMQFTVVTRNPNKRVSFFYDNLSAFVSYKNQAVTPEVVLPPLFHQTKTTVALSPLLGGSAVPVGADVIDSLLADESYGVVGLRLVLTGTVRYKFDGGFNSRRYHVYVRCDFFVGLKKGFAGQLLPPLLGSPPCLVNV